MTGLPSTPATACLERCVLVGGGDDLEFAVVDDEPCPSAAEATETGGFELGLELIKAAELLVDGFGEGSRRGRGATRSDELPEECGWRDRRRCAPAPRMDSGTDARSAMSSSTGLLASRERSQAPC